jgi:hypothetical protein
MTAQPPFPPEPGYPVTGPEPSPGHPGTMPPVGPAAPTSGRIVLPILAGLAAALVGAVLWAVLVEVSGYKIGFAAVGMGFLVGQAMALTAGGNRLLPPLGALLALLGCLLGDAFSDAHEVAKVVEVGTFTVLRGMATDPSLAQEVVKAGFSPMDLLFWGIAAWQGYTLTARAVARRIAG